MARRKGFCYVKFCTHQALLNCGNHFRGGVNVPNGDHCGYLYAERSSKELVQLGFPLDHRNAVWSGETGRYATPIGSYCSTTFGEFKSEELNRRPDLRSGRDPKWYENVTGVIVDQMLEAEMATDGFQTPRSSF